MPRSGPRTGRERAHGPRPREIAPDRLIVAETNPLNPPEKKGVKRSRVESECRIGIRAGYLSVRPPLFRSRAGSPGRRLLRLPGQTLASSLREPSHCLRLRQGRLACPIIRLPGANVYGRFSPFIEYAVPLGELVLVVFGQLRVVAFDCNGIDLVACGYAVDDVLVLLADDLAEDGVLVVKPRGRDVGDEELAAVRVGARVGHREDARPPVAQLRSKIRL